MWLTNVWFKIDTILNKDKWETLIFNKQAEAQQCTAELNLSRNNLLNPECFLSVYIPEIQRKVTAGAICNSCMGMLFIHIISFFSRITLQEHEGAIL